MNTRRTTRVDQAEPERHLSALADPPLTSAHPLRGGVPPPANHIADPAPHGAHSPSSATTLPFSTTAAPLTVEVLNQADHLLSPAQLASLSTATWLHDQQVLTVAPALPPRRSRSRSPVARETIRPARRTAAPYRIVNRHRSHLELQDYDPTAHHGIAPPVYSYNSHHRTNWMIPAYRRRDRRELPELPRHGPRDSPEPPRSAQRTTPARTYHARHDYPDTTTQRSRRYHSTSRAPWHSPPPYSARPSSRRSSSSDATPPAPRRSDRSPSHPVVRNVVPTGCAKPTHFSGLATDLPDWIDLFTNYAETLQLPTTSWTGCAISFMPMDVRAYVSQRSTTGQLPSFQEFTHLLYRKYCGVDPMTHYVHLVQEAQQSPTESIAAYGSRYTRLVQLANHTETNITTNSAIVNFIHGLRNESIQQYLTRKRNTATEGLHTGRRPKLTTLQHYVDAACNCDVRSYAPSTASSSSTQVTARPTGKPRADQPSQLPHDASVASVSVKPVTADPAVAALHDDIKKLISALCARPSQAPSIPQQAQPALPLHSNTAPGGNRSRTANAICFNCSKRGHTFRKCTEPMDEARVALKVAEVEAAAARRAATSANPAPAAVLASTSEQPSGN